MENVNIDPSAIVNVAIGIVLAWAVISILRGLFYLAVNSLADQ